MLDALVRIWTLVVKDFTQLRRDWLMMAFVTLVPLSELMLIGWATSSHIEHLSTAVLDADGSAESRALVTALENARTFDVSHFPDSPDRVGDLVDQGVVVAGIIVPEGFGAGLTSSAAHSPQVQVILDGADPAAAGAAQRSVEGVIGTLGQRVMMQQAGAPATGRGEVIRAEVRVRYNEDLSEASYTVPAEMGIMLMTIALMIASMGIARERELGTLEQIMVTPMRPIEIIIGKAIPAVIIAYVNFGAMLAATVFVFDVPFRGSVPLLLALALFYLFVELGWGLIVSAFSATQQQAILLAFLIMMPEMIFSGYAVPIENMPRSLMMASNLVPIKHWLAIVRAVMLKGVGLETIWPHLLALAVLGGGIMTTTVLVLRRRLSAA
jgi:ABC-2 type transport system permease protein